MKSIYFLLASLSLPAFAAAFIPQGTFSLPKEIPFFGGYDQASCAADSGRWDAAREACFLAADDNVVVSKTGSEWRVQVNTIVGGGNGCEFDGLATLVADREFLASQKTEEYVEGKNGGQYVAALCELKVLYTDDNTVNVSYVSAPSACENLCGAHAKLSIQGAKRIDP